MSYVAILAGAFLVMLLGWIYFHPKVLGQIWMQGAGLTEAEMKKFNPLAIIGGLLMAGVLSYAISRYATHVEPGMSQFIHGMYHGVMPAILYVAPVLISKGLFERKSIVWILVGAFYWVLAISLVGGVVYTLTPPAVAK
ncbi:MAG: DUF1761 domain-containing protein [Bacteroidia bacterium]|nr:DUF1761 domain-containing protein [Bacteroidia bacterium]